MNSGEIDLTSEKRSFWGAFTERLSLGVGKEVALRQVLRALTVRRVGNAFINLLSFLLSAVTRRPIVWGRPIIVNIEPTNLCNLRCPLCITGSGQMERPQGKLDVALGRRMIDEVADHAIYITLYHQGEPYLHAAFNDLVAFAKSKRLYVTTSTNAHFFTPAAAEQVVRSGLDSMIISLDGVTQESYAKYRVRGNLETVLTGIRNLTEAKRRLSSRTPFLFLQFLVMKHNEGEIPQIRRLAKELGVDRLLIKTTQVMTAQEAEEWLPKDDKYRRYEVQADRLQVKRGRGVCPRLWLTTLMDWDGQIVPCCFDKNGEHAFGVLGSERSFGEIWRSKGYQDFRRRMLRNRNAIDICRNCNYGIGLFK